MSLVLPSTLFQHEVLKQQRLLMLLMPLHVASLHTQELCLMLLKSPASQHLSAPQAVFIVSRPTQVARHFIILSYINNKYVAKDIMRIYY